MSDGGGEHGELAARPAADPVGGSRELDTVAERQLRQVALEAFLGGTQGRVLGQYLGDEKFPIEWQSETEKLLFWVYDDLHCPHPVSPMYLDIGGWWMSCDHMFRRFGTPFACDWIVKEVNGYVYTAAIPAEAGVNVDAHEYGAKYSARVPLDPDYAAKIGTYLGAVLPTYGNEFATWWNERLVPEMKRNFAYLEGKLDQQDELDLMQLACLLEDAIDIHDRHWKIHWMLNFAQLSATLNLRGSWRRRTARSTRSSSVGSRTRPRTATGIRSRPSGR